MARQIRVLSTLSLILALGHWANAADTSTVTPDRHTTTNFKDIFQTAEKIGKTCTPQQTIIVLDLDNTTLVANQILGSEQWYDWQAEELRKKTPGETGTSNILVGSTFDDLDRIDSLAKKTMTMHPVEPSLPESIRRLENLHYPFVILTSRNPDDQQPTDRQLAQNHINLKKSTLRGLDSREFIPYDLNKLEESGLPATAANDLHLGKPWSTLFKNGVYYTGGQDKGVMLRTLMHKAGFRPCGIVFADNKEKYSVQMASAFADQKVRLVTFRYSREDQAMADFFKGDKTPAILAWQRLQQRLNTTQASSKAPSQ